MQKLILKLQKYGKETDYTYVSYDNYDMIKRLQDSLQTELNCLVQCDKE